MASASFARALARVLASEGGYSNHPDDPGGPTNFGITLAVYRANGHPNATAADVKAMRREDAEAIYRARYWDALRCDQLPSGLDYAVFDYGVNSGVGRAGKVLQSLVGVNPDGDIGPVTLAAVAKRAPARLVNALCDERLAFLKRLRTWPTFGKGWGRRVADVRATALAMAGTPAAPAANPAAATVVLAGAAATAVAAQSGAPWATVMVIAAITAVAVVSFFVWRARRA